MSYAAEGFYLADTDYLPARYISDAAVGPQTAKWPQLLFCLPVIISAISYICGGIGILTDISFLLLTCFCILFFIIELINFPKRQGIGAILIYLGVLVWFCHDYMSNWFGLDFNDPTVAITSTIVAKAAFYHTLFVELMLLVFRRPFLRWVDKLVVIVPEPASPQFYLIALILINAIGLFPFFVFVNESVFSALWKTITFHQDEVLWTVGRSIVGKAANLNYAWGGYVAQVLQIGTVGGILGAAYAVLIAKNIVGRVFGLAIWAFWCAYSFTSYRRGDMAFMVLPMIGFLYYYFIIGSDFPSHAAAALGYVRRKINWVLIYPVVFVVGGSLIVLIQYQFSHRSHESFQAQDVFAARGDTMFSEGMKAWRLYGERNGRKFYSDDFIGATIIEPIPVTFTWFAIDWIPRALWTTKPIDQFEASYNDLITGEHFGLTGTTVSGGAVGQWYFRYGPAGVIEGALVYGWLMGVAERALRRAKGRPIAILFAFCFATFMFRAYRDLWFHLLYPMMIAQVVLFFIVWPIRALPAPELEPAVV